MRLSAGRPEVVVGLIDGPVAMNHPDLAGSTIRELAIRRVTGAVVIALRKPDWATFDLAPAAAAEAP